MVGAASAAGAVGRPAGGTAGADDGGRAEVTGACGTRLGGSGAGVGVGVGAGVGVADAAGGPGVGRVALGGSVTGASEAVVVSPAVWPCAASVGGAVGP